MLVVGLIKDANTGIHSKDGRKVMRVSAAAIVNCLPRAELLQTNDQNEKILQRRCRPRSVSSG